MQRPSPQPFALRAYPEDIARLKELREQIQAQLPMGRATLADALAVAVGSASAALANGALPEALRSPPRRSDRAA
jgi:hypothetical protein